MASNTPLSGWCKCESTYKHAQQRDDRLLARVFLSQQVSAMPILEHAPHVSVLLPLREDPGRFQYQPQ